MSGFLDISRGLFGSVVGAVGDLDVAWENDSYTPVEGRPYARARLVVTRTDPGMGQEGLNQHWGLLEISLFYPLGIGIEPLLTKADEVATVFRRGTTHTSGAAQVRVESISRAQVLYEKAWAQLPLNIRWHCHLPN